MTLKEFAHITISVVRDDGIEDYLPTLAFPETQQIRAIQGIPNEVDHREAIQKVVRRSQHERQEFFFGVRSGPGTITVGHHRPGQLPEFMEISESGEGYQTTPLATSPWWTIS